MVRVWIRNGGRKRAKVTADEVRRRREWGRLGGGNEGGQRWWGEGRGDWVLSEKKVCLKKNRCFAISMGALGKLRWVWLYTYLSASVRYGEALNEAWPEA